MNLVCTRCGQHISVPDDWAGKAVRCNGCNKIIRVPAVQAAEPDDVNLEALGSAESAPSAEPSADDWPDFHAIGREQLADQAEQPAVRTCPFCGKQIHVDDPNLEVLCSNCWRTVPPAVAPKAQAIPPGQLLPGATGYNPLSPTGFYTGVFQAVTFPFGAAGSIVLAILVAIGLILLPVGLLLSVAAVMKQEPVYGQTYRVDWAGPLLAGLFLIELLYFIGVAYYAFIDTVRSTLVGSERPPDLTWNITTVGQAFLGYISLVLYYAVLIVALIMLSNQGQLIIPSSAEDFTRLLSTPNLLVLALLTLMVPMSLIGMASGRFLEGINPVKVLLSISRTAGHYTFLFCLDCLYVGVYAAAVTALLRWTGRVVLDLLRQGVEQTIPSLAVGLLLWGLLIGVGLYFAYVMGRVHGLFARAFRQKLLFDM